MANRTTTAQLKEKLDHTDKEVSETKTAIQVHEEGCRVHRELVENKFDRIDEKFAESNARMDRIEKTIEKVVETQVEISNTLIKLVTQMGFIKWCGSVVGSAIIIKLVALLFIAVTK